MINREINLIIQVLIGRHCSVSILFLVTQHFLSVHAFSRMYKEILLGNKIHTLWFLNNSQCDVKIRNIIISIIYAWSFYLKITTRFFHILLIFRKRKGIIYELSRHMDVVMCNHMSICKVWAPLHLCKVECFMYAA